MRRTRLRGHGNALKRPLIHAGGFNPGLVMRALIGVRIVGSLFGRRMLGGLLGAAARFRLNTQRGRP